MGGRDNQDDLADTPALLPSRLVTSSDQRVILFIGQLIGRKGFDLLARAMPAVVQAVPQANFVFVSHNRQGEAELQRLVAAGGVADRLHLLGSVDEDEKIRLLRSADVIAAPSRYEGFGIPLIEGMAAGKPVVTTDVPAGNELIEHEHTGLLVPYDDVDALAAALVRVLHDPALAQRLVAAGRQVVCEHYTAERLAAQLESWYARFYLHKR
jgi:glycosyltransferase involved in cell wall biosynthesis